MPGCLVVALWRVPCSGESPGEGGLQESPGPTGVAADQRQRCGGWRGWGLRAEYERIAFTAGLILELTGVTTGE